MIRERVSKFQIGEYCSGCDAAMVSMHATLQSAETSVVREGQELTHALQCEFVGAVMTARGEGLQKHTGRCADVV